MHYLTLEICREELFPYIRKKMATSEPAPSYEQEPEGMKKLESTLKLMQWDEYQGRIEKAAYLFCSVIDGHPFSNGNKRLSVTLLIAFLLINKCKIRSQNMDTVQEELKKAFPHLHWESVQSFEQPIEHFFYHLALILADRTQKGEMSFHQEKEAVVQLLDAVVIQG